jgi:hypothetical protein
MSGKDFAVDGSTDITLVDNVIGTHSWAGTTTNNGTTQPPIRNSTRPHSGRSNRPPRT